MLFWTESIPVRIALHLVQFSYEEYTLHGKPLVLFQRVDKLSPDMGPAAMHGYSGQPFKLAIYLIAIALYLQRNKTKSFLMLQIIPMVECDI